jgi:hypothetical protein
MRAPLESIFSLESVIHLCRDDDEVGMVNDLISVMTH